MASWEKFSRIVAEAKASKKLDPVGHEDDDVDNDGDSDSSDSYLKKRRSTVGAAIAADKKRKVEEAKQLDPVGKEDEDIDNDSDSDKSDRYLLNRRKVRSKIIQAKEEVEQIDEFIDALASKVGPVIDKGVNAVFGKPKPKLTTPTVSKPSTTSITPKPTPVPPKKTFADVGREVRSNIDTRNQRLQQAINQSRGLSNSYQPEGQLVDEGKADKKLPEHKRSAARLARYDNPSGALALGGGQQRARRAEHEERRGVKKEEFVGEDREYRREMAKTAARERAEERRSEEDYRSKGRTGKKKEGPKLSTTPNSKSAVKTYVDKASWEIENMDKKTKGKHLVGNPFPEQVEYEIEEGIDRKRWEENRKKAQRAAATADARSRGHEGSEWHNTGRTYSPDEAKRNRAKLTDDERSARHASAVDPDNEDHSNYPASKTKNPKKLRKQKAMGEETMLEKAPPGANYERMVKYIKKGYSKDGLTDKEKGIAYATAWKAYNKANEELSLVDRMIANFSPLSEGKLDDLLADIRGEDGGSEKKKKGGSKKPSRSASPESSRSAGVRAAATTTSIKRGRGASTGVERAAATTAAGRTKAAEKSGRFKVEAEKQKTARQEARFRREDENRKRREEQKKESEVKKQERIKSAEEQKKKAREKREKETELSQAQNVSGPKLQSISYKEPAGSAAKKTLGNMGSLVASAGRVGKAIYVVDKIKREEKRKQKEEQQSTQQEQFSNWREEFIFEVDDQTVQNEKEKIIDVSKKKNIIEINPNMSEECGCDEKEKETPVKDMRELPTKVNLAKTKMRSMGVRNPIVMVGVKEDWQSVNRKDKTDGLSQKAVDVYRRENPGSKLQTAVTEKKPTGKRAERRKSFCSRMKGHKAKNTSAETARDPDSNINKALRRWNCN